MNKLNNYQFIEQLIAAFPEIKEEVLDEDYTNLITLQVGCFKRFTQDAIDNNNKAFIKCFEFVDGLIEKVDFNIENSLTISWLGKLNFDNNKNAYSMLSAELKDRYILLQNYYEAPLRPDIKNFLDSLQKNE